METVFIEFPEDVAIQIAHDVRDLLWREVMQDLSRKLCMPDFHLLFMVDFLLDRGYTVRNYMENWAVIPRYIHQDRAYGSYIRRGRRFYTPL